ncbi:unnamed protein product [Umbelopsis ramanniana]
MSFSLYGDLPKPKSSKGESSKEEDGGNLVAKGWAAVAPTPTLSSNESPAATSTSTFPRNQQNLQAGRYIVNFDLLCVNQQFRQNPKFINPSFRSGKNSVDDIGTNIPNGNTRRESVYQRSFASISTKFHTVEDILK